MLFKYIKIANSCLDELGAQELPGVCPLLAVRGENAVAKKVLPISLEVFPFSLRSV